MIRATARFWMVVGGGIVLAALMLVFVLGQSRRVGIEAGWVLLVLGGSLLLVLVVVLVMAVLSWPRTARLLAWAAHEVTDAELHLIISTADLERAAGRHGLPENLPLVLAANSTHITVWAHSGQPPIVVIPRDAVIAVDEVRARTADYTAPGARLRLADGAAIDLVLLMRIGPFVVFPPPWRAQRVVEALSR